MRLLLSGSDENKDLKRSNTFETKFINNFLWN